MSGEELIEYRVEQLESAVVTLADGQADMREFMVKVGTYMKVIAYILGVLALVAAAALTKLLVG